MIALNDLEVKALLNLELTGAEEVIRQRFVVGCLTGMRFSDYSRVTTQHIDGKVIRILTTKRKKPVVIPLHPEARKIISSLGDTDYSLRYYNMKLPLIAQKAGIRAPVIVENKIAPGKVVTVEKLKYELVTTHTARRSFATNAYHAGIPVHSIMMITGHATEDDFFKYIKVNAYENANELLNHKFFKG